MGPAPIQVLSSVQLPGRTLGQGQLVVQLPLSVWGRGRPRLLPKGKAVFGQVAEALAGHLQAKLLKLLLVVWPHKPVEACWEGCCSHHARVGVLQL